MSKEKLRILVFGATGTGKTSLCNLLTGRSRPTDSGALGVTSKPHHYSPFEFDARTIEVIDTVGLHESSFGTVPAEQAVMHLIDILSSAKDGFNLLIHVAKAGRITKEHEEDYDFFVNKMTQRRIPVLLAVAGCENESPMSSWVSRNKVSFRRFLYKDIVPGCYASGGVLESHFMPLRLQSREALLSAISAHANPEAVRFYGPGADATFNEALTRIWNEFVDWAKLPARYRADVNETVAHLLKRIGVPKSVADAAIKHIPDLVGELGNKVPIPFAGKGLKAATHYVLSKLLVGK